MKPYLNRVEAQATARAEWSNCPGIPPTPSEDLGGRTKSENKSAATGQQLMIKTSEAP
ncbi:hypothetical protein A2U01_0053699 [Trifolium medium]|uniref:Uncharacterized protein n=1 Tax=Trifolium medium TaxID=97028 RepID=A0A392RAA0_9FABA|nr:hypothetical protein [Trifolium medium]